MKNLLSLFLLIIFSCCQTADRGKNEAKEIKGKTLNEKSFINLGGEEQYVEITGDSTNPVLLFLHGGPGWPQTPHLRYFNSELTNHVVLVSWDQSGCGQSYMKNPNPKRLSLNQIIADAHELTEILKDRFKKDKIYLVGFSWGSIIGLELINKYPEDYSAYFGITQVINLKESNRVSRKWIMGKAKSAGDEEAIEILNRINQGDTSLCNRPMDCFMKQYELLSKYGGSIYRKESEEEIQKAETKYEDYKDYNWFEAFFYSAYRLEEDLFATDLSYIKEVKVPVYFFMGRHDWNLPTELTMEYASELKAPKKEFVWFENSGHEPLEEEADKFNEEILRRIVK